MSHLRHVVHPHRKDTVGVLVAATDPCISMARQDALNQSGRVFHRLTPADLVDHDWPRSWCMAVVLCKGDDTKDLAAWIAGNKQRVDRVHFYIHPDAEPRHVLAHWNDAGHPVRSTWPARSWKDLSRHFGARLNMQCHDDFCTDERCPLA